MNVLVTGHSGFIGSHLVRELSDAGHQVSGLDLNRCQINRNILHREHQISILDVTKYHLKDIDVVYHLAGRLGTTELFHEIEKANRINVSGTLRLLETSRENGVKQLLFTSKPNMWRWNPYTITKLHAEKWVQMYNVVYGMENVIVKPFNVYGPREFLEEYRKAIPYFVIQALKGEPLEIFGDGTQNIDPIYVTDTAVAMIKAVESNNNEIIEIGTGIPVTVNDLVDIILELTNSKSKIEYLPMRRGEGSGEFVYANGLMKNQIGYEPETSLPDGLTKTIEWYSENLSDFEEIYQFKPEDFNETK